MSNRKAGLTLANPTEDLASGRPKVTAVILGRRLVSPTAPCTRGAC